MSAPETNVKRQKRNHWPALAGIAAALGFAAIITLVWTADGADELGVPDETPVVDTGPEPTY